MQGTLGVGSIIEDRFELVDELGEGGFATVFRARQKHLDRFIAVKVLNISLLQQEDESFEERFLHEARLAAQIGHPNVVTIHEFGFAGKLKQPYIAMEMLSGHDLDKELYSGPMLPSRMLKLMLPCLDALAAGHDLEIVHKDLKPANLFISKPGTPVESLVILDYGVARWNLDSSPKFTATGAFTGTPAYMAPEYATKQIVTPAIDVYQMGLVIAETMTALPLVMEETPWDCLMVHTEGKVVIPDIVANSPLGPVISAALNHDHRKRPDNALQLRRLLESIDPEELDNYFLSRNSELAASEEETLIGTIDRSVLMSIPATIYRSGGGPSDVSTEPPVVSADTADTDPDPPTQPDSPFQHSPNLLAHQPTVRTATPPKPAVAGQAMTAIHPADDGDGDWLTLALLVVALITVVAVLAALALDTWGRDSVQPAATSAESPQEISAEPATPEPQKPDPAKVAREPELEPKPTSEPKPAARPKSKEIKKAPPKSDPPPREQKREREISIEN